MKKSLCLLCGVVLVAAYADAQSSNNEPTTNTDPSAVSSTSESGNIASNTSSSSTNSSGRVIDYTPGSTITLDDGTGAPVRFVISNGVQVIGPNGNVLAATAVEKNAMVRIHLTQEGTRSVVDQINLETAPR